MKNAVLAPAATAAIALTPEQTLDRRNRIVGWFDKYLKPGAPSTPRQP